MMRLRFLLMKNPPLVEALAAFFRFEVNYKRFHRIPHSSSSFLLGESLRDGNQSTSQHFLLLRGVINVYCLPSCIFRVEEGLWKTTSTSLYGTTHHQEKIGDRLSPHIIWSLEKSFFTLLISNLSYYSFL